MRRLGTVAVGLALVVALILAGAFGSGPASPKATQAHPGNTDSAGCHTCRTNCPSWGLSYGQYHCHTPRIAAPLPRIQFPTPAPTSVGAALSELPSTDPAFLGATQLATFSTCTTGDPRATTLFFWRPAPRYRFPDHGNGIDQWVDLSLSNNGFQPGTFVSQHVGGQSDLIWTGLLANSVHYWRVNTWDGVHWHASPTYHTSPPPFVRRPAHQPV